MPIYCDVLLVCMQIIHVPIMTAQLSEPQEAELTVVECQLRLDG